MDAEAVCEAAHPRLSAAAAAWAMRCGACSRCSRAVARQPKMHPSMRWQPRCCLPLLRACRMRSAVAYCRNVVARAWAYRPRHSSRLAAAARLADSLEHALAVAVVRRRRLLAVRTYRKEGRHAKALACSMPQYATGSPWGGGGAVSPATVDTVSAVQHRKLSLAVFAHRNLLTERKGKH